MGRVSTRASRAGRWDTSGGRVRAGPRVGPERELDALCSVQVTSDRVRGLQWRGRGRAQWGCSWRGPFGPEPLWANVRVLLRYASYAVSCAAACPASGRLLLVYATVACMPILSFSQPEKRLSRCNGRYAVFNLQGWQNPGRPRLLSVAFGPPYRRGYYHIKRLCLFTTV